MAFWRKRRPGADPEYPQLSVEDTAEIRALAIAALGELGVEAASNPEGTVLRGSDGTTFGLDNVMARCGCLAQPEWAGAVAEHFHNVVEAVHEAPAEDIDLPEALTRVRSRLVSQYWVDESPEKYSYAWPVADGLAEILCLDFPTTVRFLGADDVARYPGEELRAAGRRNTAAEPVAETLMFGEGAFHLVCGESPFIASKLLELDSLVPDFLPPAPLGYVVGVPSRHYLAAHPLHDIAALHKAIEQMGAYCRLGAKSHQGAIAGELYYWRDGHLQRITRTDEAADQTAVEVNGPFAAAFTELIQAEQGPSVEI